ncbi:MAG: neutral zinc metallopeptidase, partial [Thermocrispum sp.]
STDEPPAVTRQDARGGGPGGAGSPAGATTTEQTGPPTSMPQKVIKLADHPLLAASGSGLPNNACDLPEWDNSSAAAKRFFLAATRCLDRAWEPVLRANDLPFTPPRLYFPGGPSFRSDCGTIKVGIDTAAYYCEGELFLPFGGLQLNQYQDNPGVYLALIAHEYGHHVQELAGIMDAAWRKIYQAGEGSDRGQEVSRRKELQAQCFSGLFLGAHVDRGGSITRDMYDRAWHDQETRGDDTSGGRDHGSNRHYAQWWRNGALDNRLSDCNTFAADADAVS